jgi:flagellar assembly protein FliH
MKRLIKSDDVQSGVIEAVPIDLPDVAAEARRILAEANRQARRIVDEARRQAASVEEQASGRGYEQGYARGREEGLAEGRRAAQQQAGQKLSADLTELTALARKIVEELAGARQQILQEARAEMLDFAVELAGKIVGRVADSEIEAAGHNVRKVLELAGGGGNVTVLVNPTQLEALRTHAGELVEALRYRGKVKVEGDERIGKGGAKLVGRGGEIDATIATQLANVAEALRGPANTRE